MFRRWLPLLLIGALLLLSLGLRAYDNNRMMAAASALGPRAQANAGALQQLIAQGSRATDDSRVRATNQFFNDSVHYADDIEIWGVSDYWASPLEMLAKGVGDCEDYSIGKYFALLSMGMPPSKLRMVFVRAMVDGLGSRGQAHMVVAFYPTPGAEPLILDNLVSEVLPASRRPDLVPVYSFNSEGLWQGVGGQITGDPISRLSKWRDVLAKARAEGF
ncbi:transglutaminase-like cysteine peptidase [Piscinibacter sakaiensis]|uniref:transglutaminase-like cysteine peptidase n=1 Tax=Piscinibacter sakaiensis TaxID=1547922 RepID=UPI003AAB29C3